MFKRVLQVHLNGYIGTKMYHATERFLRWNTKYIKPKGLIVRITSNGGSIAYCKNLGRMLQIFSRDYDIPFFTVVDERCLSEANILLCHGHKVYANP